MGENRLAAVSSQQSGSPIRRIAAILGIGESAGAAGGIAALPDFAATPTTARSVTPQFAARAPHIHVHTRRGEVTDRSRASMRWRRASRLTTSAPRIDRDYNNDVAGARPRSGAIAVSATTCLPPGCRDQHSSKERAVGSGSVLSFTLPPQRFATGRARRLQFRALRDRSGHSAERTGHSGRQRTLDECKRAVGP